MKIDIAAMLKARLDDQAIILYTAPLRESLEKELPELYNYASGDNNRHVLALTPCQPTQTWFYRHVWDVADGVCFPQGAGDCCIVYYGNCREIFVETFNSMGKAMDLCAV